MAEGLWHMTGALPVLVATLGPGVANAVNVVANAAQDRVPLVFLTGCVDAADAETYTHQVFDHQALLRPIVKGSFRLTHGAVGAGIAKAISLATSGQPGPVHVDIPIGVAEGVSQEAPFGFATSASLGTAASSAIETARAMLAASERPIAIAGVDAVLEGAGHVITAFCRTHSIPLVTTYKGKGLLDESDPLSLGGAGLSPRADRIVMDLLHGADCILLLGYDPIEMRHGWRNPWTEGQRVIEIAPFMRGHGMHRVDLLLQGGLDETLGALAHDAPSRWPNAAPSIARDALKEAFRGTEEWGPHAVFHTLRRVLPDTTIATADSGAHRILASQIWRCSGPRLLLQSSGLCTMACAVPLAAGAKLGRPEAPVVALVGDGGLEMGAGELATLRDAGLAVVICVLVDDSLSLIEMKQRASGRSAIGVDFALNGAGTDFATLATAFGGHGVEVADAESLEREVLAALERPTFTLIAARIGRRAYDGAF
jgi:acetolactate synthase-1/2/3 large subunit